MSPVHGPPGNPHGQQRPPQGVPAGPGGAAPSPPSQGQPNKAQIRQQLRQVIANARKIARDNGIDFESLLENAA